MGLDFPFKSGTCFISGNIACAVGAILAGCRFFAGYPITPSTEITEYLAKSMPKFGGVFLQMEDEIASITAVLGASWAGIKSMTATSGPGFSLMMESIGFAAMTETPCVIVDVMRAGPSTGIPTKVGQGDIMQARWGSHGVYEIISLAPWSPQEMLNMTVRAFNLSEKFRVPVIVLADEVVGHLHEKVRLPDKDEIEILERKKSTIKIDEYFPFKADSESLVPPMAAAGEGYRFHITGLSHDECGYPSDRPEVHERLVRRLIEKIRINASKITEWDEYDVEDAELIIVAYGSNARSAMDAKNLARRKGLKVGLLRLKTLNPIPEGRIEELASKIKAFLVAEVNHGQMALEVKRLSSGMCAVHLLPKMGGEIHRPLEILNTVKAILRGVKEKTFNNWKSFQPQPPSVMKKLETEKWHPCDDLLRVERLPHIFCPGCGLGIVMSVFIRALKKSNVNLDKVTIVSGIGCAGRIPGYLKLDGFHVTHGRAIPFATGLKLARPELTIVVIGGDGDLFAIGGNHFIHAARRGIDMLVICINNFNYGLTGGQVAPTTPLKARTSTTPYGNTEAPFNLPLLAMSVGAGYVARWTIFHAAQLEKSILECLGSRGFKFIEVVVPCPTGFGKRNMVDNIALLRHFKTGVKIRHGADPNKATITTPMEPFIIGRFKD
jgi:2-oxoglutarate ferredoxin oxidoreductase subunit alpha